MQRLIILRGASGSGKSTIAKSYRNFEERFAWLKVDNFKDFFAEDSSVALDYVNGAAVTTLRYLLEQGFSVVMEGIFQNTEAINEALEVSSILNVSSKVFELDASLDTLKRRDLKREGVPEGLRKPLGEATITRLYNILKENPYPNAIKLNTEELSLEECKRLIDETFDNL